METRLAGQTLERHNVATVERTEYPFTPEENGLSLEEGKSILRQAQLRMVQTQADILELLNEHVYSASAISESRISGGDVSGRFLEASKLPAVVMSGAHAVAKIERACGHWAEGSSWAQPPNSSISTPRGGASCHIARPRHC